jgi:hypothetical protein
MGAIPGFKVEVLRNDSPVRVKSGSLTWEHGKAARSWDLTFAEPINVSVDDLWDISLGFAGNLWPKVTDGTALKSSISDGVNQATTQISSDGGFDVVQDILNYAVPQTYCFINSDWLSDVDPTARIVDGVVLGNGTSGTRLFHPRLPGKDIEDENIKCIMGPRTHHDIGRYLANLVGFDFVCNTPDIDLVDTFTVPSGTIWWEAIKANFAIWQPTFQIIPAKDASSRPTIYVLDVEGDDASIETLQTMTLSNATIVSVSTSDDRSRKIVDHLIVMGRNFRNRTNQWDKPDMALVKLTPVEMSVDETVTSSISYLSSAAQAAKNLGEMEVYSNTFGAGVLQYLPERADRQEISIGYHVERGAKGERWIPITQTVSVFGTAGNELSRVVTAYKYSKSKQILETYVNEYGRVWFFKKNGSDFTFEAQWMWTKQKATFQDIFKNAPDLSMTREVIHEVIVCDKIQEAYVDPKRLSDIIRNNSSRDMIDKDYQYLLTCLTAQRWTEISRSDPYTLIKRDWEFDTLSGSSKFQDQILETPIKDKKASGKSKDDVFRREYFKVGAGKFINGIRCYHPAQTVKHDDIDSETICEQIRDRVFNRTAEGVSPRNLQITVKTPVPIPIETMAMRVILPDSPWTVNGTVVTIPGGTYYLKRVQESFSFEDGGELKYDQTLTLVESLS